MADGKRQVVRANPLLQVALGDFPGVYGVNKFGRNDALDSLPETLWGGGGLYPWQDSAFTLEVVSDSEDDSSFGVGAQSLLITGLDDSWNLTTQTVNLSGSLEVFVPGNWLRVFRAYVVTAGSNKQNSGTITVRIAGFGATQAVVLPAESQTVQTIYTIPAGKTGLLLGFGSDITSKASNAELQIALHTRENDQSDRAWRERDLIGVATNGDSSGRKDFRIPIQLSEKTDIELRVIGASGGTVGMSGFFDLLVID